MENIDRIQSAIKTSMNYSHAVRGLEEILVGIWFLVTVSTAGFLPHFAVVGTWVVMAGIMQWCIKPYYVRRTGYVEAKMPVVTYGLVVLAIAIAGGSIITVFLSPSSDFSSLWWLPLSLHGLAAAYFLLAGIIIGKRRYFYEGMYFAFAFLPLFTMPVFRSNPWVYLGIVWGVGFICCGIAGHLQYLKIAENIKEKQGEERREENL